MATVRISKELLSAVEKEIDRTARSVKEATITPRDPMLNEDNKVQLREAALLKLWVGTEHLRTLVLKEWLVRYNRMDITIGDLRELQVEGEVFCPPDSRFRGMRGSYVEVHLTVEETAAPVFQAFAEYNSLRVAHISKFETVKVKVISFLKSCASVNDALKKYPDIALYLPQSVKDKVAETSERKTREKREKEESLEALSDADREMLTANGVVGAIYTQV